MSLAGCYALLFLASLCGGILMLTAWLDGRGQR